MNESVVVFILFCAAGIGFGADPAWLGRCALAYTLARAAYAACYWGNSKLPRSISFGLSLVSLGGLGVTVAAGLAG